MRRRPLGNRQTEEQTKTSLRHRAKTTAACFSLDLLFLRPDLGSGWHLSDNHPAKYGFPHVRNGRGILRNVRGLLQTLSRRLRRMWLPWALIAGAGLGTKLGTQGGMGQQAVAGLNLTR